MAMNGVLACGLWRFCAMVLDSLDGRVARMTNTQSALASRWIRWTHGVLGGTGIDRCLVTLQAAWAGLQRLCIAPAPRCVLARFNEHGREDKRYFQACLPAAAGSGGWLIWLLTDCRACALEDHCLDPDWWTIT